MATVETIRSQIWKLERLDVEVVVPAGAGKTFCGWDWANEAPGNWRFSEWKAKRFLKLYPNLQVRLAGGNPENTSLKTLRGD